MNNKNNVWWKWIYWFTFAVAVIAVYKTLDSFNDIIYWIKNLISIIFPFIMAILISYILYIPCNKVESVYKKCKNKFINKRARKISIFTVYILLMLACALIIKFVVPSIYKSIIDLVNNLPAYYEQAINYIKELPEDSVLKKVDLISAIENLGNIDFKRYLDIQTVTQYIKSVLGLAGVVFDIFVTIIISIYILLERRDILKFARKLCSAMFKTSVYKDIGKYFRKTNEIFFKFLSSQFIDAIIVGVLTSIAMLILNVKYALLLGFLIGLFNLIPYLGAILAVLIAALITIFTGGIKKAIIMAVVVIILQQIDANIINPKIIGSSLEISPILVIFSVTLIGAYFGVIGMFLAVPITAVIKLLINDFINYKTNNY